MAAKTGWKKVNGGPRLQLLLVNAPSRVGVYQSLAETAAIEPPVWAGLIARYCLNLRFSVQILDAEAEGLTIDETAQRIEEINPHLAAFCIYGHQPSASTQCMPAASAVARQIRWHTQASPFDGKKPKIYTTALGTHPSALPEKTVREEGFDSVCQGEGPETIHRLLRVLTSPLADHVPGLWFRQTSGLIEKPPPVKNIVALNTLLPNQAWELLDMKRYRPHHWHLWSGDPKGGYASVQTSLGCPFACSFCCINAPFTTAGEPRNIRFWSPRMVAEQIHHLSYEYGITNIKIPDEMFVLNRNHVKEICEWLLAMGLGDKLNMWAYARVDTVKDTELLDLMRKAGFKWLGIGIESASKHVRDGMEKGRFGNEQILDAINRVRNAGFYIGANYIFGLPDDTHDSMQDTLDLACEINGEYTNLYCAMAYPGSPLHALAKTKGWKLPEDEGGPGWLGYSQHNYETLPLPTETLTAEEVLAFRDYAFIEFHERPEYLGMLQHKFGPDAAIAMKQITDKGKPKRKILE